MINVFTIAFNAVAEEIDVVAAKLGNIIALSPTGLMIVCATVVALGAMLVYSSHKRKPQE